MFSGSFGVRSIVLCKCSGKYIDIYFKLKNNIFMYSCRTANLKQSTVELIINLMLLRKLRTILDDLNKQIYI